MKPHYADDQVTLYHGDCIDVLRADDYGYDWNLGYREARAFADNSVDAVVCDPPYGLEFMGKDWDAPWKTGNGFRRAGNPADAGRDNVFGRQSKRGPEYFAGAEFQQWCTAWASECLRILKPGGHMVAFGGSRTWHRLAAGIEDAGFEIRDSIAWLYGSGFPKSLDVSKAIDKAGGNPLAFRRFARAYATAIANSPLCHADVDRALGIKASSCFWAREDHRGGLPPRHHWDALRDLVDIPAEMVTLYDEAEREVIGQRSTGIGTGRGAVSYIGDSDNRDVTVPATEAAKQWQGWGTALKPSFEPIVVARKPLSGTVAANVLEQGTGALNIDACRVAATDTVKQRQSGRPLHFGGTNSRPFHETAAAREYVPSDEGRWPTNVVLDEDQAAELDQQTGTLKSGKAGADGHKRNAAPGEGIYGNGKGLWQGAGPAGTLYGDEGGASRFFPVFRYEAKAPSSERPSAGGVAHPTVKPLDLMRWLVRLVTPPNGLVLEPFAGSGTTAEACIHEHMRCIAIEREAEYLPLILARLTKPIEVGFDFTA